MSSITDLKFAFKVNGATPDLRRATLVEGGPLQVHSSHWLYTARSVRCSPTADGNLTVDLHFVEYVFLDVFDWPDGAVERGMVWYILPDKVSRFLAAGHAAGLLKWQAFAREEDMVQHLREVKRGLPPADQAFTMGDVHAYPEPAPILLIMDRVRASMLREADGSMTAAVDFKTMLSDAYVQSRRDAADGHHQSMLAVMLDAASQNDLASKPLPVQASTLCRFILSTQPPRTLRRYLPYEMQEQEISRRSLSEEARFVPLLVAAWDDGHDGGYKELKHAILHACSGQQFVDYVKLLAVRARMTTLTHTTCAALCDMLRGDALAEVDTTEMRAASIQARCAKLGDFLTSAVARSSSDKSASGADTLAAEKMRASPSFVALVASLEALVSATPDYKAVIKCLAPTAVGRMYLNGGTAASPIMAKFAAARNSSELDEALNHLLAVDEAGAHLGKTVVQKGLALKVCFLEAASETRMISCIRRLSMWPSLPHQPTPLLYVRQQAFMHLHVPCLNMQWPPILVRHVPVGSPGCACLRQWQHSPALARALACAPFAGHRACLRLANALACDAFGGPASDLDFF